MKLGDGILSGLFAILSNKMRSFLTMLGITIGVAAVLSMIAIGEGAKHVVLKDLEMIGGANHFRISRGDWIKKGNRWERNRSGEYLTYADVLSIEAECPSVVGVWPRVNYYDILILGPGGEETRTGVIGTTPFYEIGMNWGIGQGRFLSEADIIRRSKACVLGLKVATELFGNSSPIGQEVKIILDSAGSFGGWRPNRVTERFRVVGVMAHRGIPFSLPRSGWNIDDRILIPLTTMQERFTGNDHVRTFSIQAKSVALIDKAIEEVKRVMRKRHRNQDDFFSVSVMKQNFEQLEKVSRIIKIMLGSIASFSLLVGGIGIMNMMLVSVTERTREIGLQRALGAKRKDILYQFLVESVVMGSVGGLIGIGLGIFAGQGMANLAVKIVKVVNYWPAIISVRWLIISFTCSTTIGIVFGLFPAIKAARLSPIEALRVE